MPTLADDVLTSLTSLSCRVGCRVMPDGVCRVEWWRSKSRDVTVHIGTECAPDQIAMSNWSGHGHGWSRTGACPGGARSPHGGGADDQLGRDLRPFGRRLAVQLRQEHLERASPDLAEAVADGGHRRCQAPSVRNVFEAPLADVRGYVAPGI